MSESLREKVDRWTYRPRMIAGGALMTLLILAILCLALAIPGLVIHAAVTVPGGWRVGAVLIVLFALAWGFMKFLQWITRPFAEWLADRD